MISKGNQVKLMCFLLLAISEEDLLDLVFVISRIIKVLITPTSILIILDITKTSSNNCLLCHQYHHGEIIIMVHVPITAFLRAESPWKEYNEPKFILNDYVSVSCF